MVNTQKIKGRITEKGLTIQKVAPKVNLSPYTLGKQINNRAPMNLRVADALKTALDIPNEQIDEYFFIS